jgi:hypothetical protein
VLVVSAALLSVSLVRCRTGLQLLGDTRFCAIVAGTILCPTNTGLTYGVHDCWDPRRSTRSQ